MKQSRVATRIYSIDTLTSRAAANFGHNGTTNTSVTCGGMMDLEAPFDAVRFIFANNTANTLTVSAATCASSSNTADLTGNVAGIFSTPAVVKLAGSTSFSVAAGTQALPTFAATDWVLLPSAARTDGGTRPLLNFRFDIAAAAGTFAVPTHQHGPGADWGSSSTTPDINGRWYQLGWQASDAGLTVGSAFNANGQGWSYWGWSAIVGVQYRVRSGRVMTVLVAGDSITSGNGISGTASTGRPWSTMAQALESSLSTPTEFCSLAISGMHPSDYLQYCKSVINTLGITPSVGIFAAWSPNDGPSLIPTSRANTMDFVALCESLTIYPVVWTGIPRNSNATTSFYTLSDDNLRKSYNADMLNWGVGVIDMDSVMSDGASPARIQMTNQGYATSLTADFIHPNAAGDLLMRNKLRAMLVTLKSSYFATP